MIYRPFVDNHVMVILQSFHRLPPRPFPSPFQSVCCLRLLPTISTPIPLPFSLKSWQIQQYFVKSIRKPVFFEWILLHPPLSPPPPHPPHPHPQQIDPIDQIEWLLLLLLSLSLNTLNILLQPNQTLLLLPLRQQQYQLQCLERRQAVDRIFLLPMRFYPCWWLCGTNHHHHHHHLLLLLLLLLLQWIW